MGFWGGPAPTGGMDPDVHMPWQVDVEWRSPRAVNGSWTEYYGTNNYQLTDPLLYGVMYFNGTSTAPGDWAEHDVTLSAGTWSLEMVHYCEHNQAIRSIYLDGTLVGAVDGYANPGDHNRRSTVSGIIVPTTGRHTLRIVAQTRHDGCDGWLLGVQHITLRRTQ